MDENKEWYRRGLHDALAAIYNNVPAYNSHMNHDGTEDFAASAYVGGIRVSYVAVDELLGDSRAASF